MATVDIKETARNVNLYNYVNQRFLTDHGWMNVPETKLSKDDIEDIISVIGNRCRKDTKGFLRVALNNVTEIEGCGVLERLQYGPRFGWSYCAGQDYVAELKTLRSVILKNFK